jgi:hypothetical protein
MVENNEKIWIKFLSKHWQMFVLWIVIAIIAAVGAVYVFLWFVGDAQATGLVPETLDLWTMNHVVFFILNVIFWEILFIVIPVIIIVALIWQLWWKRLPDEERVEYKRKHLFGKRSRRRDGGGAISFFINIVFIIKIYLDNNWDKPFAEWKFDYLVHSYLWAIVIVLIILGIPMAIGATWWIRHMMKKET